MTRERDTRKEFDLNDEAQWNVKPNFRVPKKLKS